MVDTQLNPSQLQPYLPEHIWQGWQTGETLPAAQYLQAVSQTVFTYLPHYIVQSRLNNPHIPDVSGIFVQATMMFADISGFTAMSEQLTQLGREGAEIITNIVNDYFATMLDIIAQYQGDLYKFGGDAILVAFEGDQAAFRGCQAAWQMQSAMGRFARLETEQGNFNLRMSIGLGTGTLFLASLGDADQREFAVMGLALGQMAQAENLAQPGEIVMDEATFAAAGSLIAVETYAATEAAGFYRLTTLDEQPPPYDPNQFDPSLIYSTNIDWLLDRLNALTPYLPPGILPRIVANPHRIMIEGEHRLVTVLFANFYGIDEIIQALGVERPSEIITILNRHFTTMQDIINQYGGMVNKVDSYAIGHRIMAVFGAPVAHEDDPARAVHAALEMQAAMTALAEVETSVGRFSLKQRIGINTGYVFAGNLGSPWRQEYSVMGDEVNLAARLMGVASADEVLISDSTARHVSELFEWQEREPVKVKGKSKPVRNYQVHQQAKRREALRRGVFWGRQAELEKGKALIDALQNGRGAILDITGERGIGKSRFTAELNLYAASQHLNCLHGEAVSYNQRIPYLPWLTILRLLFHFDEGEEESAAERRDKVIDTLTKASLADWSPIVGNILGVSIAETPLTLSLDAQLRQQRFFDVILQLIQQQAQQQPLVLTLDNMQWADTTSLDLVTYIARNVSPMPLLLIIIHRTGSKELPWYNTPDHHTIALPEMDKKTCLSLARAIFDGMALSPSLRDLVLERAQGNALFVEEVSRALYESDAVQLETTANGKQRWTLHKSSAGAEVPTTITNLIMSRIDRLETTNRRLLQVASVMGITFRSPALARIYPYGDLSSTLLSRLTALTQRDLLLFTPPEEHAFKHTLTQEVAYESLPFARRRDLHGRVGKDIEQHHAGELVEYYGELARHFDEGRVYEKALIYLVAAGHKARAEYANDTALSYYHRALEIMREQASEADSQFLELMEAIGDIYLLIGRYPEAIQQFTQASEAPTCPARKRADLLQKVAKAYEHQGEYDEALHYLANGRQVLLADEQDALCIEMARIHGLCGWIYTRRGEMETAVTECTQGLNIIAALKPDDSLLSDEADLYNALGTIYADLQSNYSEAEKVYEHVTELRQQAGDLPALARSYNNLARVAWAQGDLARASDYLQQMLAIGQQIGANAYLAFGYNNLGVVSFSTGETERALEYYDMALALRRRMGDSYGVAQTLINIGEALVSQAQYTAARQPLEEAADICKIIQNESDLPDLYCLLARIELAQENGETALTYAQQAREVAKTIGNLEWQGIAERILAQGYRQTHQVAQAVQTFTRSIELLSQSENRAELGRSHCEFGRLLLAQAQRDQASHHLHQARDIFTALGSEKDIKQVQELLATLATNS